MGLKIATYFIVLVFALPIIAMTIRASIAIVMAIIPLAVLTFICWVVWKLFSAIWNNQQTH